MNIFNLVSKNLLRRKGRFVFTLLGITIGMAAFVALLSLGSSMQRELRAQAGMLDANLVITPTNWCAFDQISILTGEALPESLHYDVMERISSIYGITAVPYLTQRTAIQNLPVMVTGIYPNEMKDFRRWEIAQGVYFAADNERAVVLGSSIANNFDLNLGDVLTIRGEPFPVIAVLSPTGSNDDTSVYLPLTVVQEIYEIGPYISFIVARVSDITNMDSYIAAIVDVVNVSVTSDEQLLSTVLTMLGSVNATLQLIAGVALISAAFGIANTMMAAIYERRREIGILRAIGGKSSAIFKIFLLESGLYGLLGGIIGVVVGFVASIVAAPIIAQSGISVLMKGATPTASFDVSIVITAILFSIVISVVSGLYPALKAAKLTPVEAISYD
ncbi:MAG: ABC transporter permease [Defluviitaleaceae bacterium]|nr:ABC transporter permease [Defluviitaleaceae bacterium]